MKTISNSKTKNLREEEKKIVLDAWSELFSFDCSSTNMRIFTNLYCPWASQASLSSSAIKCSRYGIKNDSTFYIDTDPMIYTNCVAHVSPGGFVYIDIPANSTLKCGWIELEEGITINLS